MSVSRRKMLQSMGVGAVGAMGAGAMLSALLGSEGLAQAGAGPVFELRVYHCYDGKLNDLLARFRDHTITIFKRHGMESVAYWTPTDEPLASKTLFYILKHPSREAAKANWAAFMSDPEWKQVSAASEANGKIVEKADSTFLVLTDFSMKL
jgi:hypothetical protein